MSAFALISGRLWKAAEARTTKTGAVFAVATVRVGDRDLATWWNVVAFADVGGPLQISTYLAKDGTTKVSPKLSADRLASPRIGRRPTEKGAA